MNLPAGLNQTGFVTRICGRRDGVARPDLLPPVHLAVARHPRLLITEGTILTLSPMAGFQTHISKCSERGVKLNFFIFFSYGHPQQKGLQGKEFSGMGAS